MKQSHLLIVVLALAIFLLGILFLKPREIYIQPTADSQYIGSVALNENVTIRILILKHCRESLADDESRVLIQAANFAASKGLKIQEIGDHHVDKDGKVNRMVWGDKFYSIEKLQAFVSEQMKKSAQAGDTLVIYTTGHGSPQGSIQILGSRKELGLAFAKAAEENNQETLWWQSSCYAASGLPTIAELNDKQKKLFSMIASSTADKVSYWGDQPPRMKKVFEAIADKDKNIDPDQDGVILAKELAAFMNTQIKAGSGDLLFAKGPDEPIFGLLDLANMIPIMGRSGEIPPIMDDGKYIPHPLN